MSLVTFLAPVLLATLPAERPATVLPAPLVPLGVERITGPAGFEHPAPVFALDAAGLEAALPHERLRLAAWPLPDGGAVDLDLERLPVVSTGGGQLWVDGLPSGQLIGEGISLWSGEVAGEPDSDVFLALSIGGTRGWIRRGGASPDLAHVLAEPHPVDGWEAARVRMVTERSLGFGPATPCSLDDLPNGGRLPGARPTQATAPAPEVLDTEPFLVPVLRELTIALETDHNFYQLFGNLTSAQAYALSLMGAVSARYREQVDMVITLPYLGLYTTSADPWTTPDWGGGSVDMLYEFQAAWYPNMPVEADLGHLLSGASLGGGVAWLDTVCVPEFRFAVSGNLGGDLPLPVAQGPINWDFVVTAHEIGHNLSTLHTHDYCPPLDECAPSGWWGSCQTQELCITDGTVMSYCHLCPGGLANVTTYFHPTVVQTLRARVEDSCLGTYEGLFLQELGGAIAGSKGIPEITPTFDPVGDLLGLDYAKVPAGSLSALVVGGSQIDLPLLGGTLVPFPASVIPFTTSGSTGSLPPVSFAGAWIPTGATFYVQAWFGDAVTPFGYSASAGEELELVIPDPPAALTWFPHPTNGREYALASAATWFQGQATAKLHGGDLASLTSPALETWLKTTFVDSGLLTGDAYIGFTDQWIENGFQWISGDPAVHTNWASGEPNDWNGFEDYAVWAGGPWNDVDGYTALPALIER